MVHDGEVALEGEGQGSVPSLREDGLYPSKLDFVVVVFLKIQVISFVLYIK